MDSEKPQQELALSPRAKVSMVATAVVVVAAALKVAAVAVLPVVAALLLAVMLWPLRTWLTRWMPNWLAATVCGALMVACVLLVIGWASYASVATADQFRNSREKYVEKYSSARSWFNGLGVPEGMLPSVDGDDSSESSEESSPSSSEQLLEESTRQKITQLAAGGLRSMAEVAAALTLTIFLACLALAEGEAWAKWFRDRVRDRRFRAFKRFVDSVAAKTRRYFLAKTVSGTLSGLATGIWLATMSVPLAIVWGVFTFAMNFIPNIGAIISGVPPTVLAIVQLGWTKGLVVAGGLLTIEVVAGNLVDPYVLGNMMKLSTFVVLCSLVFWGWMWGVAGAVMAPVLTVALLTAISEFNAKRTPGDDW